MRTPYNRQQMPTSVRRFVYLFIFFRYISSVHPPGFIPKRYRAFRAHIRKANTKREAHARTLTGNGNGLVARRRRRREASSSRLVDAIVGCRTASPAPPAKRVRVYLAHPLLRSDRPNNSSDNPSSIPPPPTPPSPSTASRMTVRRSSSPQLVCNFMIYGQSCDFLLGM